MPATLSALQKKAGVSFNLFAHAELNIPLIKALGNGALKMLARQGRGGGKCGRRRWTWKEEVDVEGGGGRGRREEGMK